MSKTPVILWVPALAVLINRESFRNWLEIAGPGELIIARIDFLFSEDEGVKTMRELSPRALNFLGDLLGDVMDAGFQLTRVGTGPKPTDIVEFGGEYGEAGS